MDRRMIKGIICILITALLSVFFLSGQPAYATSKGVTYDAPENVRAVRNSSTSIRVRWKTDTDVVGYIIYRYDRSEKDCQVSL